MSNEDREAARELAADLGYIEAAKFLRSQIGCGLRDAIWEVEQIAFERPASRLAESIAAPDALPLHHPHPHPPATRQGRMRVMAVSEARKDDAGKDPWDLAPWDAFRAIVGVLAFGAKKYAPRNWEQGLAWSRLYAATLRHLTAWWEGEERDPETGLLHLAHAGCCVCFLLAYALRGGGTDDRPGAQS